MKISWLGNLSAVAALVLALSSVAGVAAQNQPPLGEVARKEAERRKAQPSAGKVYTNNDLPVSSRDKGPSTPASSETIPLTPAETAVGPEQKQEVDGQAETKDETWWKTRVSRLREDLRRNELFAEALQSRINALSRDFVNRDNPVQRARIGQDRAEALTELARVRQDIERDKKQLEDIEEEARKAGVPPGWLR